MKLSIHMVCSCKFVRADVCVGRFVVNLRVDSKQDCAFSCGSPEVGKSTSDILKSVKELRCWQFKGLIRSSEI